MRQGVLAQRHCCLTFGPRRHSWRHSRKYYRIARCDSIPLSHEQRTRPLATRCSRPAVRARGGDDVRSDRPSAWRRDIVGTHCAAARARPARRHRPAQQAAGQANVWRAARHRLALAIVKGRAAARQPPRLGVRVAFHAVQDWLDILRNFGIRPTRTSAAHQVRRIQARSFLWPSKPAAALAVAVAYDRRCGGGSSFPPPPCCGWGSGSLRWRNG